mmetsp:Transcript_42693/g.68568  ORF Transcript_42693/g.68568 Transcript_42693/m.68568 type:complete len:214 (+) Transcript_42693:178-819(+)
MATMDLAALGLAPAFGLAFVLVLALLLPVLLLRGGRKDARPTRSLRTLVVLGSGGHTTEMLSMLASMPKEVVKGSVFIVAATDTMSQTTLETQFPGAVVLRTPRAREVRQSWLTSVFTTLVAAMYALRTVVREQPDLVLCNGPGTCVPVAYAAWLMRLVRVKSCSIVFTESIARVNSLSLSGRLLYPIVDKFMVQWPDLLIKYPRARYVGFVI